jgi:hypothetical protein
MSTHRRGFLHKQGSFFSSWTEKFYQLDSTFFKQFSDSETPVPSYSIYLGTAAVEGVFSAEENDALGFGPVRSFVLRWPTTAGEWGYMHLGSYDAAETDEWCDTLSALIRVAQVRKLAIDSGTVDPVSSRAGPGGDRTGVVKKVVFQLNEKIYKSLSKKFQICFSNFLNELNNKNYSLMSSNHGLVYSNQNSIKFRFIIKNFPPKRLWESLLSNSLCEWAPAVLSCHSSVTGSVEPILVDDDVQIFRDEWRMVSTVLNVLPVSADFDRVAFRDEHSGNYFILGLPSGQGKGGLEVESFCWVIEQLNGTDCLVTNYFCISRNQDNFALRVVSRLIPSAVPLALLNHSIKIQSFIPSIQY